MVNRDSARTAGANQLDRYSVPYDTMFSNKEYKEKRRGYISLPSDH